MASYCKVHGPVDVYTFEMDGRLVEVPKELMPLTEGCCNLLHGHTEYPGDGKHYVVMDDGGISLMWRVRIGMDDWEVI